MAEDVVAIFSDPDAASGALRSLREQGVEDARIASPAPYPVVNQTGHPGPWRVLGWIAFGGGLTGFLVAASLQAVTSLRLGLVVGGKPILSWPAFGVVMFELTMLFAGVANFSVLVLLMALSRRRLSRLARRQVSSERIVVVIPGGPLAAARREAVRTSLAALALEVLP
jgi:Protein of unknown function (DUF3341)